jgi:hypothetical protein
LAATGSSVREEGYPVAASWLASAGQSSVSGCVCVSGSVAVCALVKAFGPSNVEEVAAAIDG